MLGTIIKIVALVLSVVIVVLIGFTVVNTIVNLFEGHSIGEGLSDSWNSITHLFGLIKESMADIEIPMANRNITWTYAKSI